MGENIITETNVFRKTFSDVKIQLLLLFISGLLIRIYYTPFELPITLDGVQYFWYAIDTSILGELPTGYNFPNNGWSVFLSLVFNITNPDTFLDFHVIQRFSSIIISAGTIFPIFLICRKFFGVKIAIFGACIFVFEPRLLINSVSGLPESLFIFLFTLSIYLFLSNNFKKIYIAFGVVALLSLIRYEGFLLIFPFFILLFFKFNKWKKNIPRYILAISIFILILLPMMHLRIETTDSDGVVSNIIAGSEFYQNDKQNSIFEKIVNGSTNMIKFLSWQMIPYLVFFIPGGIILFFKKFDFNKKIFFICTIIMLIPAFYAFSREFSEMKYLFITIPILTIISLEFIEKLSRKIKKENLLICLLVIGIIFSSLVFLEFKKIDYNHEIEAYKIGIKISTITNVINDYEPESRYLMKKIPQASMLNEFPVLFSDIPKHMTVIQGVNGGQTFGCKICYEAESLSKFLNTARIDDLEYLLVDDNPRRPQFMKDILNNEVDYRFLEKIYDSKDDGLTYHVKIFQIDYEKFDDERK